MQVQRTGILAVTADQSSAELAFYKSGSFRIEVFALAICRYRRKYQA